MNIITSICARKRIPIYLEGALSAIEEQNLRCTDWEIVLTYNASDKSLVEQFDLSYDRHVRADELRLTRGRKQGRSKSKQELNAFVDHSFILDVDYLDKVVEIANEWLVPDAKCLLRLCARKLCVVNIPGDETS